MHEIVPGLFCGTQPRNPQEVEELSRNHGVSVIMNLQQDKDIQHWGIDFGANQHKCNELGVTLLRKPVGVQGQHAWQHERASGLHT